MQTRKLMAGIVAAIAIGGGPIVSQAWGQQNDGEKLESSGKGIVVMDVTPTNAKNGTRSHIVYDAATKTASIVYVRIQDGGATDIEVGKVVNYSQPTVKINKP
jgi:hypothetical protein